MTKQMEELTLDIEKSEEKKLHSGNKLLNKRQFEPH